MRNIVLISENKSVQDYFKGMLSGGVNFVSNSGITNLIDYLELCDEEFDFIIDITRMPVNRLNTLLSSIPIRLKLIVIASIPFKFLPEDYQNILSKRSIKFFEYPLTNNVLKEINYN